MHNLLLIGPSNRIKEKDYSYYKKFKDKGYTIISYTGSIPYLCRIKVPIDYFCFIDPYTIYQHEILFQQNLQYINNITLLGFNLYNNEMDAFYNHGLSSSSFIKSLSDKHRKEQRKKKQRATNKTQTISYTQYLQNIFCIFKDYKLYDPILVPDILNLKKQYDFTLGPMFFSGYRKITNDKFLGVLLPLVFNLYNPIDHIHCIGFGDFNNRRCGGSSLGYSQYQRCAKLLIPIIKQYIIKSNINLTFEHSKKNFFYDKLIKSQNND